MVPIIPSILLEKKKEENTQMPDGLIMKYPFSSVHKSCHSVKLPPAVSPSAQPLGL